jgi:phosphopantetheinyl transferase
MRDFAALGHWMGLGLVPQDFSSQTPQQQQQKFHLHWTLAEAWFKQAGPAASMHSTRFAAGADGLQALLAQTDDFTLALCPAQAAATTFADPELVALRWAAWGWPDGERHCAGL